MTERAGVLRSEVGLSAGMGEIAALAEQPAQTANTQAWQTTNLVMLASALMRAARLRTETRGSHWREDFPDRDDLNWQGHIDVTIDPALDSTVGAAGVVAAPGESCTSTITQEATRERIHRHPVL